MYSFSTAKMAEVEIQPLTVDPASGQLSPRPVNVPIAQAGRSEYWTLALLCTFVTVSPSNARARAEWLSYGCSCSPGPIPVAQRPPVLLLRYCCANSSLCFTDAPSPCVRRESTVRGSRVTVVRMVSSPGDAHTAAAGAGTVSETRRVGQQACGGQTARQ